MGCETLDEKSIAQAHCSHLLGEISPTPIRPPQVERNPGPSQVPDHIKIVFFPVFVMTKVNNTQDSGRCSAKQLLSGRDPGDSRVPF